MSFSSASSHGLEQFRLCLLDHRTELQGKLFPLLLRPLKMPSSRNLLSWSPSPRRSGPPPLLTFIVCLMLEVLRTTQGTPKPTQASTQETGAVLQSTPKIKEVLDQNVNLSNVDQVPANAHLTEKESQLYIFEDNEAVIKIIIKGRSPKMRRVPHPPSCARLIISTDPRINSQTF